MTLKEAKELMANERACVIRASTDGCQRECDKCDLLRPTSDILEAYTVAIKSVDFLIRFIADCKEYEIVNQLMAEIGMKGDAG